MSFKSTFLWLLAASLCVVGCGGGGNTWEETTYQGGWVGPDGEYYGGIKTGTAKVKEDKNGNWQTESGDPAEVVGGQVGQESDLPDGGSLNGLKDALDEGPQ